MAKNVRVTRLLVCGVVLALIILVDKGCEYLPESTFDLADQSRLPKWVALPPGLLRANVSITLSYYIQPWGRGALIEVRDTKKQLIQRLRGKVHCTKPFHLKTAPGGIAPGYPAYEAISVGGVTDIVDHKQMEPIFYMTDDAVVWEQYQANGCG